MMNDCKLDRWHAALVVHCTLQIIRMLENDRGLKNKFCMLNEKQSNDHVKI
jgi:hypothetical protein